MARLVLLMIALLAMSGCFFNDARTSLDDLEADAGPTVGGRWSERGFLAEDDARNGVDRGIASAGEGRARAQGWLNDDQLEANRRDALRESGMSEEQINQTVNSGNTPDLEPSVRRPFKNGMRATRADFIDESRNEGSLWGSDGQTNYYFTKNKIRGVGDIVTLTAEADLIRDMGTEVRRKLTPREKDIEYDLATERVRAAANGGDKASDKVATSSAAPERAPAKEAAAAKPGSGAGQEEAPAREVTLADVDVSKSLEIKSGDSMMGEIIERYPNGNYKVRATKRVPYRNGAARMISLVGVVRGVDISEEDVIPSSKLYEYRIEATR